MKPSSPRAESWLRSVADRTPPVIWPAVLTSSASAGSAIAAESPHSGRAMCWRGNRLRSRRRLERRIEVVRRQENPGVGALARRGHHRAGGQCVGEPGRVDARRRQATSRAECRLTVVQRERHAAHAGAGQPDRGYRYFEAQPAAGRRHVAHARARHGAVGAQDISAPSPDAAQYARCSQLPPLFHCSISTRGGLSGSR